VSGALSGACAGEVYRNCRRVHGKEDRASFVTAYGEDLMAADIQRSRFPCSRLTLATRSRRPCPGGDHPLVDLHPHVAERVVRAEARAQVDRPDPVGLQLTKW
jgi:hypothetical protein